MKRRGTSASGHLLPSRLRGRYGRCTPDS
jgi:hypothetical protein